MKPFPASRERGPVTSIGWLPRAIPQSFAAARWLASASSPHA
jgi:hypothetical protein